mgnify:FL=1
MHRYIAEMCDKTCNYKSYMLITANNLKEAQELVDCFKHKSAIGYDYFSVKLYTGQRDLMEKVIFFISKKWIKFRNE